MQGMVVMQPMGLGRRDGYSEIPGAEDDMVEVQDMADLHDDDALLVRHSRKRARLGTA